jgi:putative transposase
LATVIDAHSRRVIGWAIADHMRTDLIQDALMMAMVLRGDRSVTVIFHSDRGTQYASAQIIEFAAAHGITRSMGYTG